MWIKQWDDLTPRRTEHFRKAWASVIHQQQCVPASMCWWESRSGTVRRRLPAPSASSATAVASSSWHGFLAEEIKSPTHFGFCLFAFSRVVTDTDQLMPKAPTRTEQQSAAGDSEDKAATKRRCNNEAVFAYLTHAAATSGLGVTCTACTEASLI